MVKEDNIKNFDFNKAEYEYILENCNFTDRQKEILDLRRKGYSIIQISMYEGKELPASTRAIDREIRKIKLKIFRIL